MEYVVTSVLLGCITALASAQISGETKFKRVGSLNNKISDHSLIARYHTVQTELSCARECTDDSHCSSFFYNKNRHFCSLHSEEEIRLDQTSDMEETISCKLLSRKNFTSKGYAFSRTAGIWYKGYPNQMTWTAAVRKCEDDGAILISPTSQKKRELVNYIKGNVLRSDSLIGCKEDITGHWIWMDGTAVNETLWAPNEPHDKYCCRQNHHMKLYTTPCYWSRSFVCEIFL